MTVPTGDHRFLDALNQRFAAIAGWSYDYRWVVVAFGLALVIGSTLLSWRVEIDNSYEAYFDPSDPAYQAYEQYRDDFGSDEVSYILYEAPGYEHGVWNVEVMRQIAEVTRRLEDVPFIYDVQSIVNAELIEGTPDGIDILEIEDAFPLTQEELLVYRDKVLSKPMLVGGIASEDKTHGAIIIDMDRSSTDPPEAIIHDPEKSPYDLENLYPQVTDAHIEAVLNSREYEGIRFYHAGDVPLNAVYNRLIMGEGETLELITSFVIGTILLLAGVAHAVHILSEFGDNYRKLRDRREALVRTVYLVGTPCLITSLTTAIGFASMSFVPIKAIAESGVYNSFGIFMAFVMSFTLLMSLLSMGRREMAGISGVVAAGAGWSYAAGLGSGVVAIAAIAAGALALGLTLRFYDRETRVSATSVKGGEHLRRALLAIAAFDIRHRKPILAAFAVVFAISGVGITRVVADSNWLDDFSDEMPLKGITQRVDRVMGGSTNVIYLFDSGEPDGIKEPAVLREMERIQEIAGRHGDFVRKSYSLVDILKDLNQAFHGGDPAYYTIPESRELVAQYLLLYEMSGGEEAEEMVTSDYQRASVELRLALAPTSKTAELVNEIEAELTDAPLEQADVSLTGIGALWIKLLDYIVSSQIQGFLLAFCAIALIMVLVFRSFGTGIISMIPNLTPVALTLGVMGWAGIFLDYNKISIASVAIGIAVDDTIHLIFRYRHEFDECGNYEEALERAMQDVGKALLITSAALVAGFLVLTLSTLDSQATYGILLATTIVTALIADFLLMPVLVLTFQPFGPEGAQKTRRETLREAA
jgi:predicted RND superfamily exporter protein